MRNSRAWMMIGVSLVAGILAIVFAARWLNQQGNLMTGKVAVAAIALKPGQQLLPEHVKMVDWPAGSIPACSNVPSGYSRSIPGSKLSIPL